MLGWGADGVQMGCRWDADRVQIGCRSKSTLLAGILGRRDDFGLSGMQMAAKSFFGAADEK